MADLVTRLRLDNKEFDNNIRASKKQIEGLKTSGSKGAEGLGSLITKFKGIAAGIGVAQLAMQTFDTAINSNSTLQNAWNDNMIAMKNSVDDFFTALTTGDWSIFEGGLIRAMEKGKQFARLQRQLSLGLKMTGAYLDLGDADFKEQETIINDPNSTKEQKEEAFQTARGIYEANKATAESIKQGFNEHFSGILKGSNVNVGNIKDPLQVQKFLLEGANPLNVNYKKDVDNYTNLWKKNQEAFSVDKRRELYEHRPGDDAWSGQKRYDEYKKNIQSQDWYKEFTNLQQTRPELELIRSYNQLPDEGEGLKNKNAIIDTLGEWAGYKERMKTQETDYQGIVTKFDSNGRYIEKTTTTSKTNAPAPTGSEKWYNDQIKEKEAKLAVTVNEEDKEKLKKEIIDLKNELDALVIQPKLEADAQQWAEDEKNGLHDSLIRKIKGLDDVPPITIPVEIEEEEPDEESIKDIILRGEAINKLGDEIEALNKTKNKKLIANIGDTTSAFMSLGDTIHGLQDMDWANMDAWEKFSTIIEIIFGVINTIQTLQSIWEAFSAVSDAIKTKEITKETLLAQTIVASETEKATAVATGQAAQTTAAVAGGAVRTTAYQGEMAAASAAAYAYIPFAGPALAAAQIASFQAMILAAMAVPAFADGGIFESPLTTGDRNLARLNGGEMILNKSQQYNLFQLLDNGAPLGGNNGEITFKLRGSDIYGSLNNFNKKFSKIR